MRPGSPRIPAQWQGPVAVMQLIVNGQRRLWRSAERLLWSDIEG
jgi:hypothetical protein